MRKLLVFVVLVLSQTACSQEEASVLHIRYNNKMDLSKMREASEEVCNKLHRMAPDMVPEYKFEGDVNLEGVVVKDLYWTWDGRYRVTYEKTFSTKGVVGQQCYHRILPVVKIRYEDFLARKVYGYMRTYTEGKGPNTKNKWGFEALNGMDGTVEKESWGVRDMKDSERIPNLSPVFGEMLGANKEGFNILGKEKVAGFTCVKQQAKIFLNAGDDGYMCVWSPGGKLPDIVLKGRAVPKSVGVVTIEAKKVDLNADVSPSMLRPPAEWKEKPNGVYKKTSETEGRWFNKKEMKALKKAKSKRSNQSNAGGK